MEWIEKNAIELYECSSGLSKAADQFGFGYPFLSYSDIFHNYYVPEKLLTLVNSTEKERKSCSVKRGDVFLTRTSETTDELGMSCVALQDYPNATFNGFAKRLRPITNEIVPEYASYFFRSSYFRAQCMSLASLITRASLNEGMIGRLKIRYPKSKDAQAKIGSILKNYDNLIENNNKRIKILEQMAENLYKEWFVRFRFPGHETTPFENGIPKGWKLKHVSEIGDIIGGGTPSTDNEEYWNGNIPWLSPADLTDYQGVYIDKGANNITELGLAKSSAKMMPKDTVLLSSRAPIGYVALAKNDICTNQGFKSIVCNQSIMKPSYLYLYFKLNKSYLQSFASGATFPELSGSMVKKLKVLVPDISLLEKFDTFAKKLFEKTDILLTQNQNLIKQRDLLLPRLMSGKLAV